MSTLALSTGSYVQLAGRAYELGCSALLSNWSHALHRALLCPRPSSTGQLCFRWLCVQHPRHQRTALRDSHTLAANSRGRGGITTPGPKTGSGMASATWNLLCRPRAVWERQSNFLHGNRNPSEWAARSIQPLTFANTDKEFTTAHYSLWGLWYTGNRMKHRSVRWLHSFWWSLQ